MYLLVILNKSIFHSTLIKTFHSLQNWKPYMINFFFLVQYLFSLKCIFKLFFANFYMYYLYCKVASNDSMCTHTPVLSTFCHTFKNNLYSFLLKYFNRFDMSCHFIPKHFNMCPKQNEVKNDCFLFK